MKSRACVREYKKLCPDCGSSGEITPFACWAEYADKYIHRNSFYNKNTIIEFFKNILTDCDEEYLFFIEKSIIKILPEYVKTFNKIKLLK